MARQQALASWLNDKMQIIDTGISDEKHKYIQQLTLLLRQVRHLPGYSTVNADSVKNPFAEGYLGGIHKAQTQYTLENDYGRGMMYGLIEEIQILTDILNKYQKYVIANNTDILENSLYDTQPVVINQMKGKHETNEAWCKEEMQIRIDLIKCAINKLEKQLTLLKIRNCCVLAKTLLS